MSIVLLDTSAVIAFLQPDHKFHLAAVRAVTAQMGAGRRLAISTVSVTELFTGTELGYQEERTVIGFLDEFDVARLPVSEEIARRASEIRVVHAEPESDGGSRGLVKVPDALILATGDLNPEIEILVGADKRWKRVVGELQVRFVDLGDRTTPFVRRMAREPHGMRREELARLRRARLYGGMIAAVDQHGYRKTTVAHVIALAGVSRRAFYEEFSDKEDCFLGTYDVTVARAQKRMLEGWAGTRGWRNRVHGACQGFLNCTADNAESSRLVLIEGLGLGPVSRERLLRAALVFERQLAAGFRAAPDGVPLPPLGPRAIVGGARYALFDRLLQGREAELPVLTDELLDWIAALRSSAARVELKTVPEITAKPAHFLERDEQRTRIMGAIVHLTLDQGFSELTEAQIVQLVGISTDSFHGHFPSKSAGYIAVLDAFVEETVTVVTAAAARGRDWTEAAYLGVKAGVEHFAMRPGLVKMLFVDLFDIGPEVVRSLSLTLGELSLLLRESSPVPVHAPQITHEMVIGGLWAIIAGYAVRRRAVHLPKLADHLAFLVLAPYVGPQRAAEVIAS